MKSLFCFSENVLISSFLKDVFTSRALNFRSALVFLQYFDAFEVICFIFYLALLDKLSARDLILIVLSDMARSKVPKSFLNHLVRLSFLCVCKIFCLYQNGNPVRSDIIKIGSTPSWQHIMEEPKLNFS